MSRGLSLWVLLASALFGIGREDRVCAQEAPPTEYQVKAYMLVNFANFVEWPEAAFERSDDPIIIGVIGKDPLGKDLEKAIESKSAHNRKFLLKHFNRPEEIALCHILYVAGSEKDRWQPILEKARGQSILTINEDARFARQGGVIGFVVLENKVRFEINAEAAQKSNLKINSQLFRLAVNTRPAPANNN